MDFKYLLKIFVVSLLILSIIFFINFVGFTLNDIIINKELKKIITVEGLENKMLIMNESEAFCETNKGFTLEKACNELTKQNCNLTSCCVWTSNNKCKAGNKNGALFNSDSKGKTIPLDYYYFQNKCYGNRCV